MINVKENVSDVGLQKKCSEKNAIIIVC